MLEADLAGGRSGWVIILDSVTMITLAYASVVNCFGVSWMIYTVE
ncbi:MAG: hypothetical protein WA900_07215 [Casimicrobiaceae bacterium]